MSRTTLAARSVAALASLALLTACGDRSAPAPLAPRDTPAFLSAGSSSADWQQCANNGRNDAIPCEWINSVLNVGKATYREGELIPFRFAVHLVDMENKKVVAFKPNAPRSVTFTYGFNKGTNGNYDFIGKFNQTEGVRANLCSADFAPVNGVYCNAPTGGSLAGTLIGPTYGSDPSPLYANADGTRHSVITIDSTKFLQNVPAALKLALSSALKSYLSKPGNKLEIDVFGGVGQSVDPVVYNIGGSDVTATITVRFTANQPNVLIAFGAHFARLQDWEKIGYNGGAGQSGSPFHIKVDNIDGTTVGALGNNVSGGVVVREANVSLVKTVSASTISVGQQFYWEITATNNGDGDAVDQTLTDQLPQIPGYTFSTPTAGCSITSGVLTCTPITIAASGDTFTARVYATYTATEPSSTSCGTFPNTATLGGGVNSPTVNITVECPIVTIVKDPVTATVTVGSPIGFDIVLSNTGSGTAQGVTLTDQLPSGFTWTVDAANTTIANCAVGTVSPNVGKLTCPAFTLAAGSVQTPTRARVRVTAPTSTSTPCGAVVNPAASFTTSNDGSGSDDAQLYVNCPGLQIVKKTNGTDNNTGTGPIIRVGDPVTWTYVVTNTGNVALTGVEVTDNLVASSAISCTGAPGGSNVIASLQPGAANAVTCTATGTATLGQYVNTGTATAGSTTATDPDRYFGAAPSVAIRKKTNGTDNNTPTGPYIAVGATVTWTYEVANAGNVALTNVTVTDDMIQNDAASINCGGGTNVIASLAPSGQTGSTATCTATAPAVAGQYANVGTVTASSAAGAPTPATDPDHYFGSNPSVSIVKLTNGSDGPTVAAGSTVTWTYGIRNTGNVPLTNVTVTDDQIANDAATIDCGGGTNVIASLPVPSASGAQVTCTATGTAISGAYSNIGTVVGTPPVGNNVSNTDASSYTGLPPQLSISKTPDLASDLNPNGTVHPGERAEFTITVSNTAALGAAAATTVQLIDTLPAGLTWSVKSATENVCGITTITVNAVSRDSLACNIPSIPAQGSFSVTVQSNVIQTSFLQQPSSTTSTIEIDGDLDGGALTGRDWKNLPSTVFSCVSPIVGCDIDKPTGKTDNSFGQGTKEDTAIPTVVFGSIPNNKSDLRRFYVATERVVTTAYVYLGWTRVQEPNGTTNMDFELNQLPDTNANGTPVRSENDILVRYDLSQGGTNPQLSFHKWVTTGAASQCEASNTVPCWGAKQPLTTDVQAAINTVAITDVGGGPLSARTFGEAAINLANFFPSGVCASFGQAYLKSRSSDAFGSEMKDFISPIPVTIRTCTPVTLINTASVRAANFAPINGSLNDWIRNSGKVEVTESTP